MNAFESGPPEASASRGSILVVDDQPTQRLKLRRAVEALGYAVEVAGDGHEALATLRRGGFDLVLLDLLMPSMDGFEVMAFMRRDPALRELPVVVVSALDTDMGSIVRAIESGARDFLPKDFDPVLLGARIESSLESLRRRERELGQLREIERLTEAAAILERREVDPARLELDRPGSRDDALGDLARVFADMARRVHERELALRRRIRTLRGAALLLALGLVQGLVLPLGRVVAEQGPSPFAVALWANLVCAAICLPVALYRGRLGVPTPAHLGLFALWGTVSTSLGLVVPLVAVRALEAPLIALALPGEALAVFGLAALVRAEPAGARRLAGFALVVAGLVVATLALRAGGTGWAWVAAAHAVALGHALQTLLLARRWPADLDVVAAAGGSALAGAGIALAVVLVAGGTLLPTGLDASPAVPTLALAIALLGIALAAAAVLRAGLVRSAGAVFASQGAPLAALAAIAWSAVLLDERLPPIGLVALSLALLGAALVGPKREAELDDPLGRSGRSARDGARSPSPPRTAWTNVEGVARRRD